MEVFARLFLLARNVLQQVEPRGTRSCEVELMLFFLVMAVELVEALKIVFSMFLCDFGTFLTFFVQF